MSVTELDGSSETEAMIRHHATMYRIRRFEERVADLRADGEIVGSVHLCNGQEAIYVGACDALGPEDLVFATYRGHGWAIACGAPVELLFAELMGRATGVNGGRGGSAYFSAPEWNFYGENSIVGAGAPIAMGAALAGGFDGSGRVTIAAFGDGALNQGSVHETMNFASAFSLPVLFVVENNLYSELTPIADMVRSDKLYKRASAYGMPGVRVDGNDPEKVRATVSQAVERARGGEGPALIECMTERLVGHYIGDAEQYRAPGEVEAAREREPLVRSRQRLIGAGSSEDELSEVEAAVERELAEALDAARSAPMADPTTVKEHLYA